ncbi:ABC transporter permease [Myxococcota bacterium]|nr:ABC transporter permease [Myxococcota bacterium]
MSELRPSHPLVALTIARLREFLREPAALFWVFGFPVLLAIGLGVAFRVKPPEKLRVAVEVDGGIPSAAEARVIEWLRASDELVVTGQSAEDAARDLKRSKLDLVVIVAKGSSTAAPSVAYRWDGTKPESRTARLVVDGVVEVAAGRRDVLAKEDRPVTEAGERYIDFLLPGLIGLNLMGSSMWGIGYAVVETRSRKLMKRFAATPMRRTHYLLSFILSRFAFLFLEVVLLVAFGSLAFDVRVHGTFAAVGVIATLGALSFAGLALLIAARPRTVETASGLMNLAMMPSWFLSGTFFSYERFPELVQPIIRALPLTALNDALRAVMNDGKPLGALGHELVVLTLWGVVSFVLALRLFRWK